MEQTYQTIRTKAIAVIQNNEAAKKRSYLDMFRKGFHSFTKMYMGENFITFKSRSPQMAAKGADDARKRIADMKLPLTVTHGDFFDTFIVKA